MSDVWMGQCIKEICILPEQPTAAFKIQYVLKAQQPLSLDECCAMGVDIEADNLAVRLTSEHGRLVGRQQLKSANHYCNRHLAYLKSRLDTDKF